MKKMYRYGVHVLSATSGVMAQEAGWVVPEMAMKPVKPLQPTPGKLVTITTPHRSSRKRRHQRCNHQARAVVAQAKAIVPDSKPRDGGDEHADQTVKDRSATASAAQAKATDNKAKPASANAKDKISAADGKAKTAVNVKPKASATDSKAKLLPSNAQAKTSQKISAQ
jgi:hypothetical protein